MSTILKALKRIDHTAPPPEDLQSPSPRIDPKKALRARVHKVHLYRKLYLSLLLLVAVIAAGWFAYSQKDLFLSKLPFGGASEKAPIYQAKIHPNAEQPPKQRTMTSSDRPNIRTGTSAEKDPAGVDILSSPLPRKPAQQKIPILTSSNKNRTSGQKPTAKPEISQTQISDTQKAAQRNSLESTVASTEKKQALPTQVPRSYRRLDDDKLKLQAIAWSNEAAQRIAVINGHVVREGESVEGFAVDQIRQEDVIVNDGTESWQLEFSLK